MSSLARLPVVAHASSLARLPVVAHVSSLSHLPVVAHVSSLARLSAVAQLLMDAVVLCWLFSHVFACKGTLLHCAYFGLYGRRQAVHARSGAHNHASYHLTAQIRII